MSFERFCVRAIPRLQSEERRKVSNLVSTIKILICLPMHKASQVELEFESVDYEDREKPEYPEKSLPHQRREPTTNSTHVLRRRWDLNPGDTGGRLVVSPLQAILAPQQITKKASQYKEYTLPADQKCNEKKVSPIASLNETELTSR